jgi:hypothetical protein
MSLALSISNFFNRIGQEHTSGRSERRLCEEVHLNLADADAAVPLVASSCARLSTTMMPPSLGAVLVLHIID